MIYLVSGVSAQQLSLSFLFWWQRWCKRMEGHTGMSFKVGHRVSVAVLVPLGDLQRPHHPCVLLFPVM